MMITEATSTSTKDLMRYYGVFDRREADFPMNFGLMALGLDGTLDQNIIKTLIQGGFTNRFSKACFLIGWIDPV